MFDLERELHEAFRDCAVAFENTQVAYAQNDIESFNAWRAMHEVSRFGRLFSDNSLRP